MADRWALATDVPGVGHAGDIVIYDEDEPNPDFRLCVVSPRGKGDDVEVYKDAIRRVQGVLTGSDGPNQPWRPLQLVED